MSEIKVFVITQADSEYKLESIEAFGPQDKFRAERRYIELVKEFFAKYYEPIDFVNVPLDRVREIYLEYWLNTWLIFPLEGLIELNELSINTVEPASDEESYGNMIDMLGGS